MSGGSCFMCIVKLYPVQHVCTHDMYTCCTLVRFDWNLTWIGLAAYAGAVGGRTAVPDAYYVTQNSTRL